MEFEKFSKIKPGKLPRKLLTEVRKEEASKSNFEQIRDKLLTYLKAKQNKHTNRIENEIINQLEFSNPDKKREDIKELLNSIDEIMQEREKEAEGAQDEDKTNDK